MKRRFLLVLCFMLCLVLLVGCGGKSVNLNDYVSVVVFGYDTKGIADYDFDYVGFEEAVAEALKIKTDIQSLSDLNFEDLDKLYSVTNSVVLNFDKSDNLSNGDKITLSAKIDEETNKKHKITLNFKDISTTVEGLEEIKTVGADEIFKDVVVSFNGTSPNGIAIIENKSSDPIISQMDFKSETMTNIKNGDTITVVANTDRIYEEGVIVEDASKDYTVDGLDEYLTKFTEVDEATKNSILKRADEIFSANVLAGKKGYIDNSSTRYLKNINNLGVQDSYYLVQKDGFNNKIINQLQLVYKLEADRDYSDALKDAHISIAFNNIIKLKDGSFKVDLSEAYLLDGNSTFDVFYKEHIMKFMDEYDIEVVKFDK